MDEKSKRKELAADYKSRKVIGGIYIIKNTENSKVLLEGSTDLQGIKNRFDFAKKMDSSISMKLQRDWTTFGKDAFQLEILEELKKNDNQTDQEFADDIQMLKEIWLDKLGDTIFY